MDVHHIGSDPLEEPTQRTADRQLPGQRHDDPMDDWINRIWTSGRCGGGDGDVMTGGVLSPGQLVDLNSIPPSRGRKQSLTWRILTLPKSRIRRSPLGPYRCHWHRFNQTQT